MIDMSDTRSKMVVSILGNTSGLMELLGKEQNRLNAFPYIFRTPSGKSASWLANTSNAWYVNQLTTVCLRSSFSLA